MKLNCDMGEGFGPWSMGQDAALMPYIDLANIACGLHASDPDTMRRTIALAQAHGVGIGAHPGYPDLLGFGRRDFPLVGEALVSCVLYQIGALDALCRAAGVKLGHIKPHGALYNKMMRDAETLDSVLTAVRAFDQGLPLIVQAGDSAANANMTERASRFGVTLWFEAFADRAYVDDARLAAREVAGAVHASVELIVAQARELLDHGRVTSLSGKSLAIEADTLCLHGDNPHSLAVLQQLRP